MPRDTAPADSGTDSTATDHALADALDMDIGQDSADVEDLRSLVDQLDSEVPPPVSSVLAGLVATIDELQARIDDLEAQQERTHNVATTAVGTAAENEHRLDDVEAQQETTHDVAKSAIAKAQQLEADPDHQEDAEQLPEGREPSSSPLDFFANCRQSKVKTMFVERANARTPTAPSASPNAGRNLPRSEPTAAACS